MIEKLVTYAARSLPSVIICFMGIAAFKYGAMRFGMAFKIKLWIVFLALWCLGAIVGSMFGFDELPLIALGIFVFGIFFWIVSLIFGSSKKNK